MIQINLTQEEIQLLRGLLDTILEDLRVEIHATDKMDYKDMLKERKVAAAQANGSAAQGAEFAAGGLNTHSSREMAHGLCALNEGRLFRTPCCDPNPVHHRRERARQFRTPRPRRRSSNLKVFIDPA